MTQRLPVHLLDPAAGVDGQVPIIESGRFVIGDPPAGGGGGGAVAGSAVTLKVSSATLTATTTAQDVPGLTAAVAVSSTTDHLLVQGVIDARSFSATSVILVGELVVDGVVHSSQMLLQGSAGRSTFGQNWLISGLSTGNHTVKLMARSTAGTVVVGGSHSTLTVITFAGDIDGGTL